MDISDLAYTAGIIDGEGSIQITKQKTDKARAGYIFQLRLSVNSVDKDLITWLESRWGGRVHKVIPKSATHNTQWYVVWSSRSALKILNAVLPYLVIKKNQAELSIHFQNSRGYQGIPKSELAYLTDESYYDILKKMHRGSIPSTPTVATGIDTPSPFVVY